MEVIEIVFWCSIAFSLILTLFVMVIVRRAINKRKEREELIETLEDVVMSQDKVLGQYRKILD